MIQVKLEKPTKYNSIEIELSQGKTAIIDRICSDEIFDYVWVAVLWNFRWYAYSWKKKDGSRSRIAMHRLIANTPPRMICHHWNKNSLDNREANLYNCTNRFHKQLHGIRRFGRKIKNKTTIKKSREN